MSWQDRDYAGEERSGLGRPGGDWQGMRPTFDNPFTWSVMMGRLGGITIRIHLLFIVFIVIQLLRAAVPPSQTQQWTPIDFTLMAIAMASLFLIVLAHEFGHCLACRWVGGEADEILMWPLGGLAFVRPPTVWKAHLITVLGGPAVNVIICILAGTMLGILTGKWLGVALPNPLTFDGLHEEAVSRSLAHQTLFLVNSTSLILLLFNLLPVFPLDGGRIVQSALWPRMGYRRSMVIAVRTGYVGAIALFVFGAVTSHWPLVAVALFGAVTCYITQKQLQFTESMMGYESHEYVLQSHADAETKPAQPRINKRAERQAQREQEEAKEVDRILQKIADSGIDSLSRGERALLKRVTERKRQSG